MSAVLLHGVLDNFRTSPGSATDSSPSANYCVMLSCTIRFVLLSSAAVTRPNWSSEEKALYPLVSQSYPAPSVFRVRYFCHVQEAGVVQPRTATTSSGDVVVDAMYSRWRTRATRPPPYTFTFCIAAASLFFSCFVNRGPRSFPHLSSKTQIWEERVHAVLTPSLVQEPTLCPKSIFRSGSAA